MTRVLLLAAALTCCALTSSAGAQSAAPAATPSTSATAPASGPQKFATVDALLLVDLVLDAEPIKSARATKGKELDQAFRTPQKELMDLEAKLMMGAKDDPKREGLIKEWEQKKKALNDLQTSLTAEFDKYNSMKAAEAWNIVTGKVDQLAAQFGYTHVLSTRRERSFIADTQAGTVQQLLSRSIIVYPAADDLTDRAITLMNLQTIYDAKKAEEAKQAAEQAANRTPIPLTIPAAEPKKVEGETGLPKRAPGFPAPTEQPKK